MSEQVRIRRDTKANLDLIVPASSELAHDTTNTRVNVGNGAKNGGVPLANMYDIQNNTFITGAIGGTANALTLTITEPPTAYVNGQRFLIKPTANNTGATTINVSGLGTRNIQKNVSGTFAALTANDLISGVWYEITFDGTQFQLASGGGNSILSSNIVVFTASGTYTPPPNVVFVKVTCLSGGGGGGGAPSSTPLLLAPGGGGGTAEIRYFTRNEVGASQSITVGTGGGGGSSTISPYNGGNGGQTSFGSLLVANGATGGSTSTGLGGSFGSAGSGSTRILGGVGGDIGSASKHLACWGGNTFYIGQTKPPNSWAVASNGTSAIANTGAGGSGGVAISGGAGGIGGNGASGIVIIEEFRS